MPDHAKPRKPLPLPKAEPAMVRAVSIVLGLLASLGVGWAADVDADTIATVAVVASVLVPILQALWTRCAVTANAKVVTRVTTTGEVVAGDAAMAPTGTPLQVLGASLPVVDAVAVKPELVTRT